MKKIISIILIVVMVVSFVGCDDESSYEYYNANNNQGSIDNSQSSFNSNSNNSQSQQGSVLSNRELTAPVSSNNKKSFSDTVVQSLHLYSNGALSAEEVTQSNLMYIQKIRGTAAEYGIIEEYIKLLCSENFKLVDKYYYEYNNCFFSYLLEYTGSENVNGRCGAVHFDNYSDPVDMVIWGSIERGKLECRVDITYPLEFDDKGYRYNSSQLASEEAGESLYAGVSISNGKFVTSDGRFSTKLNEAMIIKNGNKVINAPAEYVIANDNEKLKVYNYDGSESLFVALPKGNIATNNLYTHKDFAREKQSPMPHLDPNGFRYDDTELFIRYGENWTKPEMNNSPYSELSVRVMYYGSDYAVFYVYANSVTKIEMLCAIDMTTATVESNQSSGGGGSSSNLGNNDKDDEDCPYCEDGKVDCLTCGGKGYMDIVENVPGKGTVRDVHDCPSLNCDNGKRDCSYCGGTGKKR